MGRRSDQEGAKIESHPRKGTKNGSTLSICRGSLLSMEEFKHLVELHSSIQIKKGANG